MDVCHPRDNVPVLGLWLFSNFLGGMENKTKRGEVSNKRREKKREWKKEIQTVLSPRIPLENNSIEENENFSRFTTES